MTRGDETWWMFIKWSELYYTYTTCTCRLNILLSNFHRSISMDQNIFSVIFNLRLYHSGASIDMAFHRWLIKWMMNESDTSDKPLQLKILMNLFLSNFRWRWFRRWLIHSSTSPNILQRRVKSNNGLFEVSVLVVNNLAPSHYPLSFPRVIDSINLFHRQIIYLCQIFFYFVLGHSGQYPEGGSGGRDFGCLLGSNQCDGHVW